MQDLGGGKIGTVGYDSPDPLEKTLKSFALDLTDNPSFGQMLNQARGEKIEVVMQQAITHQERHRRMVGMEVRQGKAADGDRPAQPALRGRNPHRAAGPRCSASAC